MVTMYIQFQAGAAAALQAAEELDKSIEPRDKKVVVLEKFDGGGSTLRSGGVVYAGGGTDYQVREGVEDTEDDMFNYLAAELGDSVSVKFLRSFVKTSKENLTWLRDLGVPINLQESDTHAYLDKCQQPPMGYNLYHSGSEKQYPFINIAKPAPRGHLPEGARSSVGAGQPLWMGLDSAVRKRFQRITLRQYTWVTSLILDKQLEVAPNTSNVRVVGVRALTIAHAPWLIRKLYLSLYSFASLTNPYRWLDPFAIALIHFLQRLYLSEITIKAASGVVLCTGGFCRNPRMVDKYMPAYNGLFPIGAAGDDGSGIELAAKAGADLAHIDSGASWKFIYAPLAFLKAVFVNKSGERLCNEDRYGSHLGKLSIEENNGESWLVLDQGIRDCILHELWTSDKIPLVERIQGYMNLYTNSKKAESIELLARRCGIDSDQLSSTIQTYNGDCLRGEDIEFRKNQAYLQPLVKPPFYAVDYSARGTSWFTPWLTMGGLKVEEATGRVVNTENHPIPGLYAAGRAASGLPSQSYVSGLSLADCIMSGRRAARHALSNIRQC